MVVKHLADGGAGVSGCHCERVLFLACGLVGESGVEAGGEWCGLIEYYG